MTIRLTAVVCSVVFLFFAAQGDAASQRKEKEWAFLLFLNANNNLEGYDHLNLNQMETVGSTDDLDVVVQWANYNEKNTYRLRIEKDSDIDKVNSPKLETLPRVDMGDYKELVNFVRWAKEHFPAKHYFIAYWNHGSGWHNRKGGLTRGVSYDDFSGNYISTEQMGIATTEIAEIIGHKVDLVGADACLMAMVEIAAELAPSTDFLVASEEAEPAVGWAYDRFLKRWTEQPKATPAEVGRFLAEEYVAALPGDDGLTLSTLDLAKAANMMAAFKNLSQGILQLGPEQLAQIRELSSSAISFYVSDYVDLGSWVAKMTTGFSGSITQPLLQSMQTAIAGFVSSKSTSEDLKDSQGVSFWLPGSEYTFKEYESEYQALRFSKETQWDQALARIYTE